MAVQAKHFTENYRLSARRFQPEPQRADGALQWYDRAAVAVCNSRRHLVSGRGERWPGAAVSQFVSHDDCRLAARLGRREFSILVRSNRSLSRHDSGNPRSAIAFMAAYGKN